MLGHGASDRTPSTHCRRCPPPGLSLSESVPAPAARRERSVPERILDAQLNAISKRSESPGPDALRALEAFREAHGPPFPPCTLPIDEIPSPPIVLQSADQSRSSAIGAQDALTAVLDALRPPA